MRLFFYVQFIFSAMNLYIFWRMRAAFGPGKWQWAVLLLMAGMVYLFTQRRAVIGSPWESAVHTVSLLWVGVILITVTWVFALDAARLASWVVDSLAGTRLGHFLRPPRSMAFVLGMCLLLSVYAVFEAMSIRTVHLTIPANKLPPGLNRLRLVVLSDVHINGLAGVSFRLNRIVEAAKTTDADILISLGDLADTDMRKKTREAELLRSIPARIGKFAVLGNHEAYSGMENAIRFTEDAGFRVLRSEVARAGGIDIVGVDDPVFISGGTKEEEAVCRELLHSLGADRETGKFILLLRHRPGKHVGMAGLFDLQLSGHTHGGQIWPAWIFTKWANGFSSGMAVVHGEHGTSRMYVSRGSGAWGPPMRLFTPPEVTVIDLERPHK